MKRYLRTLLFLIFSVSGISSLMAQYTSEEGTYTDLKIAIENKSKVKHLNLSGQKLKKVPKEVFEFYNLETLDISRNKIEKFPVELTKMKKLTEIDFSANKLDELPKEIGEMKRLQKINLFRNKIWKIPPELGNLVKLEYLNLSGNPIFRLPDELKNCTSLRFMDLRNTDMTEADRNAVKDSFPGVEIYFTGGCNCGPNN